MPTPQRILGRSTRMHFGPVSRLPINPPCGSFAAPHECPRLDWIVRHDELGQTITPLCPVVPIDPMPVVGVPLSAPHAVPEPSSVLLWVVAIGWFLIWKGKL